MDTKQSENVLYLSDEDRSFFKKLLTESVPIWEKRYITLEEAASLFNIGINKLRTITDSEYCDAVLWVGNKRLLNREKMEQYLEKQYSI